MSDLTDVKFPLVDQGVEYVGIGKLRKRMNTADLAALEKPMVVLGYGAGEPIAVVINYRQWQAIQQAVASGGYAILAAVVRSLTGE